MVEYCCIAAKFTGSMNVMEAAAAIAVAIAIALAVLPFISAVSHLLRLEKLLLIIETILRRINGVGDQNEIKVSRADECGIKEKLDSCIKAMMAAAAPSRIIHSGRLLKTLCSSIAVSNNVFQNCRRVAEEEKSSVVEVEIIEEEEEHNECVICLCKVSKGEKYRSLAGCNHGFHGECIEAWLKNRSTCPLCRSPAAVSSSSSSAGLNKQSARFQWLLDSILISGIISLLNHLWIWFINPLSFDLTT